MVHYLISPDFPIFNSNTSPKFHLNLGLHDSFEAAAVLAKALAEEKPATYS